MPKRSMILRRLRSKAGESITEVLVALMISALGLMLLAGMITASSNMITKSRDKITDYVAGEVSMIEKEGGSNVSVAFQNQYGSKQDMRHDSNSWNNGVHTVKLYSNSVSIQSKTVVLYN